MRSILSIAAAIVGISLVAGPVHAEITVGFVTSLSGPGSSIGVLYDRGIKLSASFAAPLDTIAAETRNPGEFQRTLSRLAEMQSADYLGAAHKPA